MSYEYSKDALVETVTRQVLEEPGWEVACTWTKENGELNRAVNLSGGHEPSNRNHE